MKEAYTAIYNNKTITFAKKITLLLLISTSVANAKPHPHGIQLLMSSLLKPSSTRLPGALSHANVDGMEIKILWSKVEPSEGVRNWTPIDQEISYAASLNKKISITVSGSAVPAWVWSMGARSYTLSGGDKIPLPNDPVFLAKWGNFISAFGARYDANPTVNYVMVAGIGHTVEWHTACSAADVRHLRSLSQPNPPGTAKWIAHAKTVITAFADAFPTTPFFGALANPYGNSRAGAAAEREVVDWAVATYPGRFGVMTHTLSARSSTSFYPNAVIHQYQLSQPTGFQMLWDTVGDCGKRAGYDGVHCDPLALDESLTAGVNIGGRFVEVYEMDCNSTDPAIQNTITTHRAQFLGLP